SDLAVADVAGRYMTTFMWTIVPSLAYIAIRSFLVAMDNSKVAALIVWGAVPLNALLDYILIFGAFGMPELNVEGAGLASSIVSCCMFVVGALYVGLSPQYRKFQIFKNFWRPDWEIFKKLFRLGAPMSIRTSIEEGTFTFSAIVIGWIGVAELAAHSIIVTVLAVFFLINVGIASGTTSRVGFAFGQKDYDKTRENGWVGICVAASFSVVAAILVGVFSSEIVSLILSVDTEDAERVTEIAAIIMVIAAITIIPDGTQIGISGALDGINETRMPMINALIAYWGLGFACAWYLAFHLDMGVVGFWYGILTGLTMNMTLNYLTFWYLVRNNQRLEKQQLLADTEG
ncbi:MAG: MATE family efflux transporter, partial [Alphaproteobacteria bacterium]|nr:MATE family efflux transporter [Alphaproteobacteria bacterium]